MSENLRANLLALIALGKERGFLTRGELSDQLPDCDETSGDIDRRCFGVGLQTDYTLDQISAQFGLTRERIRQLESQALRKLRKPELATRLDGFAERKR
ncbi:hypothetical protein DDK22_34735 [Cupriavidus necator]|uniref:RNA polymerase sigma-70 domain-containing protein n=2 Tax=Cupriavidus necator TaxID=106590 RepID=A0A367P8V7_CUPNE|nr:hypothetical protein DDK22_34735 [Cupriavidus necator]